MDDKNCIAGCDIFTRHGVGYHNNGTAIISGKCGNWSKLLGNDHLILEELGWIELFDYWVYFF